MIAILILLVAVGLIFMMFYNKFVRLRNKVQDSWSGIDVQLKRRYGLVPNLLETVKGYAVHEKTVLENITNARTQAISAGNVNDQAAAENMLTSALKSLFAVAENYPDLKANSNFQQFQLQLSELEDEIQMARRYYNGSVRQNNNGVETFPGVLIANIFNFESYDFFEIGEGEKATPKVEF